MERWGESLAAEIAPFGLGVTVLITGTYDTDIITDAGTTDDRDFSGPYARLHQTMNSRGRYAIKFARSPERFTDGLVKALDGPQARSAVTALGRTRRCCWCPTDCCRLRGCTTCRGSSSASPNRARCATGRGP